MAEVSDPRISPWAAFHYRDYRLLQVMRFCAIVGFEMIPVALTWQIYTRTHSYLSLGYIGLVQFMPAVVFALITGHTADRFDRRLIVMVCELVMTACTLGLIALERAGIHSLGPVYAILAVIGTARAFQAPASQALMPQLVPPHLFSNAVTWNGSIFNLCMIIGPSAGGVLLALTGSAVAVYAASALLLTTGSLLLLLIRARCVAREKSAPTMGTLLAGVRFVFARPILLGAISLDLFAVLLGGAVALLPAIARDILKTGPEGMGVLRAAPSVGAAVMSVVIAHLPPMRKAGATMLWSVVGFGVATIVFGLSRNYALSLLCLVSLGALDMISVVVRHTMVQVLTPDHMRGRVSAVNLIFIGASNELGEFESGLTAAWWGVVPAVVIGGIGTIVVTILCAWWFPGLRRFTRLDQISPEAVEETEKRAEAGAGV